MPQIIAPQIDLRELTCNNNNQIRLRKHISRIRARKRAAKVQKRLRWYDPATCIGRKTRRSGHTQKVANNVRASNGTTTKYKDRLFSAQDHCNRFIEQCLRDLRLCRFRQGGCRTLRHFTRQSDRNLDMFRSGARAGKFSECAINQLIGRTC